MKQKLIDQLLHKAGARFGAEGTDYSDFTSSKFAQLMVEEACQAFWSEACNMSDLAYEDYHRNSKKIRQHFGVKE